jgi:TfoX/Sxy family transcriptional regulator of competence genes
MAFDQELAERIRKAFSHLPNVEEKIMFKGIAFMVDGKMCVNVSGDEMMCRIDPALHDASIEKEGCRSVIMKGRVYKGYVYINQESIKSKKDFNYWLQLSLDFNKHAKASRKRKR